MKRTKSEAEETRSRLLQAGVEVFLEKGFDRASLEEIAQRVEMTRGAVYWHFKDKQCLFEELITERLNPAQVRLERMLAEKETPPLQKITSFVKLLLQLLAEDEAFRSAQQLLKRSWASVPEYSTHFSLWQDKYLMALEELFWQAQSDRAVMAHVSPRYLSTYALSLVNGISQYLLDTDLALAERRRMADRMVFMFMRSLQ
ncbi:MAG: TetR family transcriptional regulator [Bacteroidetes bacterium]|nr:TetR family transcriptional regulator [Bacteroidota bacterium]